MKDISKQLLFTDLYFVILFFFHKLTNEMLVLQFKLVTFNQGKITKIRLHISMEKSAKESCQFPVSLLVCMCLKFHYLNGW